ATGPGAPGDWSAHPVPGCFAVNDLSNEGACCGTCVEWEGVGHNRAFIYSFGQEKTAYYIDPPTGYNLIIAIGMNSKGDGLVGAMINGDAPLADPHAFVIGANPMKDLGAGGLIDINSSGYAVGAIVGGGLGPSSESTPAWVDGFNKKANA